MRVFFFFLVVNVFFFLDRPHPPLYAYVPSVLQQPGDRDPGEEEGDADPEEHFHHALR